MLEFMLFHSVKIKIRSSKEITITGKIYFNLRTRNIYKYLPRQISWQVFVSLLISTIAYTIIEVICFKRLPNFKGSDASTTAP